VVKEGESEFRQEVLEAMEGKWGQKVSMIISINCEECLKSKLPWQSFFVSNGGWIENQKKKE